MRTFLRKRWLDGLLLVLSLVCIVLMFKASSDPLLSSLKETSARAALAQFPTGNQIVFDLAVGVLAGVFMYYLVVRIPEEAKRRRVRRSLQATYDSFKEECITVYLGCVQASYSLDQRRSLLNRVAFREFFKHQFAQGQTRWDGVANALDDYRIRTLLIELEILMNEVHFALSTVDIKDPDAYKFLKQLSQILYRSKNWSNNYDDIKTMLGFLWSIHTGWSWVEGYRERDVVADMIAAV